MLTEEEIMLSRLNAPVTPKAICKECHWALYQVSRTPQNTWLCFCPKFSTLEVDPVNGNVIARVHADIPRNFEYSGQKHPKCVDLNKGHCKGFRKGIPAGLGGEDERTNES